MAYEMEPMSRGAGRRDATRPCVRCQHAGFSMQRVCVTDTHGLRGGADVDRAQDLNGAVSMRRVCATVTHDSQREADVNRAQCLD